MRSITYIILFIVTLSITAFFPTTTMGQLPNGIELSPSTSSPIPGQNVTITLKGYSTDIESANIVWYVNGVEAKRGVGMISHDITAPTLGKTIEVSANAISVSGRTYTASINIGSGSIDIIFETSGFVHPFFKGKITSVFQNQIKITAIPHLADSNGVEYDPKNLVYKWEKDGIVLGNDSGYGKQTLTIPGSTVPRPFNILVTASTRDGSKQTRTLTNVVYNDPSVRFYSNDPLYGPLFNRELSGRVFLNTQREIGVLAIPYGFDKPINNIGDLKLEWKINGSTKSELSQNESIIIRSPEGSFGTSDIGLRINNANQILQAGENIFNVSFRATKDGVQTEQISF